MKINVFLKALVYTLVVVVISSALTIYFYHDEKKQCQTEFTKISQQININKNENFYCSTFELIKSDFQKYTKIHKIKIKLAEEKVKNNQYFNDLEENVKQSLIFNQEQTPFNTLQKNIKKEEKIDSQNEKIDSLNKELSSKIRPYLQILEQKRDFLISLKNEYHSLEHLSQFWASFISPIESLKNVQIVDITRENIDLINKIYGGWYNILKTELNTLALVRADQFNESLPFKFFTDDDFIRIVGTIDFTKYDADLKKYGIYDTQYQIFDGGEVDKIIREVAKNKGFQNHTLADKTRLAKTDNENFLQHETLKAYKNMQETAKKEGVEFTISSGYRDFKDQEEIFLPRLQVECQKKLGKNCEAQDLKNKENIGIIEDVLKMTAPPGFSRHHSGYTIDLNDLKSPHLPFVETESYRWLSQNNFLNAKKFGFLPSYPDVKNGFKFGPEPEPWEYVFVGNNTIKSNIFTTN